MLEKALQSGAVAVVEKSNLSVDRAGIYIDEKLARNPDGSTVCVEINGIKIPLYERSCLVVKGIEFPQEILEKKEGMAAHPATAVIPRNPAVETPKSVAGLPASSGLSSRIEIGTDVPTPTPPLPPTLKRDFEYVCKAEKNDNGSYTVHTEWGNVYTGSPRNKTEISPGIIEMVLVLSTGESVKVRVGGERARVFEGD
jgi:hypothetical protein